MALNSPSSIIVKERLDRETIRFTLEWTIDKFKTLRKKSLNRRSLGITMRELGQNAWDGRWRILVNPNSTNNVGVYLRLTDTDVDAVSYSGDDSMDVEFAIRVSTGKEATAIVSKGPLEHTFCFKAPFSGFADLVSHDQLFGVDKSPGLLKDDCLTIVIDVAMYGEPKAASAPEIVAADSVQWYQQFVRRQAESLAPTSRPQFTDFTVYSSDGEKFSTYRALLTSHSPVFAAMLSHNSIEKQLSRCELEDVDGETVGVLLDYIHGCDTGKVTVSNAEKVLIMADKYELLDLRALCEEMVAHGVTGDNAVHCLVLASQRKLDKLKEAALNMIPKNMGTVLQNGALQEALQFDRELMQTIMEHCSKKMRLK